MMSTLGTRRGRLHHNRNAARRVPHRVALAILAMAALTGCAGTSGAGSGGATLPGTSAGAATVSSQVEPVRLGYINGDLHHVSQAVASDPAVGGGTSMYAKHGVAVTPGVGAPYPDGGTVMDHIAAGDADMALLGLAPAIIKSLNADVRVEVVALVNQIGSSIVVAPTITRFQQLKGKTVAVPSHSTIQFFLLRVLAEKEGVNLGDLTIIDMPAKDMTSRLGKGDIAAFVAWQPFPAQAVTEGVGKELATSQQIWPNHPDCVIVASSAFAKAHPEAVRRFVAAQKEAVTYISGATAHPDSPQYAALVGLATTFTSRSPEVVKRALASIHYTTDPGDGFAKDAGRFTDKLVEFRVIPPSRLTDRGFRTGEDFAKALVTPNP